MNFNKTTAKAAVNAIMRLLSFPLYAIYKMETALIGKRKAFAMMAQWVSLVPGITGEWFRLAYFQWATSSRLKDCCISFGTTFSDHRVKIGDGVYLGRGCDIGYADIGSNCILGSSVHILSGLRQHSFEDLGVPIKDQSSEYTQIAIGEDSWIGNGAIVAADIGRKCVIGAGSVVLNPIPDFSIAVGNPARVVRSRSPK